VYRFALRGRWLVGHIVVLSIAVLFLWLGFWQLNKAEATWHTNATIRARESVAAADFGTLVKGSDMVSGALYRRVTVAGHYDPGKQFVVLYRTLDEEPGAFVLTPLVTSDGTAVIVNRGWFPSQDAQPSVPPGSEPPSGQVQVTGLLIAGEGRTRVSGSSGGTIELTTIDLAAVKVSVPSAIYPAYVQLQLQDAAPPSGALRALPPPDLSSGPYFSYAVQWFLFTAVGLVGWPLLIRRAARERATGLPT
jgi:cytochrome oxidase assembly protein ShyY1